MINQNEFFSDLRINQDIILAIQKKERERTLNKVKNIIALLEYYNGNSYKIITVDKLLLHLNILEKEL